MRGRPRRRTRVSEMYHGVIPCQGQETTHATDPATRVMIGAPPEARDISIRRLDLHLTPQGHLVCEAADGAPDMGKAVAARLGAAFARGSGQGLLQLGGGEVGQALPPAFVCWRAFASRYVATLCQHGVGTDMVAAAPAMAPEVPPPDEGELVSLVLTAPMMAGAEYLTPDVLRVQWAEMGRAMAACLAIAGPDLQR